MLETRRYLTAEEVLHIPQRDLPLAVLSDNLRSLISWAIKAHEKGCYNHFMWMHRPGFVCSQGWLLKEEPIEDYLETHRLKFWTCDTWSPADRVLILRGLRNMLSLPWYKRMYDPLQIVGKWIGVDWLQIPGTMRICSDHGDLLAVVDPKWEQGRHLSPPEINREMEASGRYRVYGRYAVD